MASDDDYEFDDDGEEFEDEWEEEEQQQQQIEGGNDENIFIDENDMNDADFVDELDDEFADEFADEFDGGDGGWSDDDAGDVQGDMGNNPLSTLLNEENTAKKPVPMETKTAINNNIDEINMLPMFCGVPDLTAPAVMLGIKIKQFRGISRDQLAVWGLSDYQYIGVRLKFGRWYLHEIEPPTIEIGACNHVSDVGIELDPFRIAWTLQDRCKNAFFCATDWHQNIKMNQIPDSSAINDLMETTQKTYAQCLYALKQNKNNVTKTTEYLFNLLNEEDDNSNNKNKKRGKKDKNDFVDIKSAKRRFLRSLRESSAKVDPMSNNNATEKQRKANEKKKYEKASMIQRTRQLAEIYKIEYEVAELAVESLGYDVASEQLGDSTIKAQYVSGYEAIKQPQYHGKKSKKHKKKDDKKWWNFSSSRHGDNESKYEDDYDDIDFKMENKVWQNLKKSCNMIQNYEQMDMWVDEDDDFKMDYGSGKKGGSRTKVDQNKVMDIVNLGMGFTMQQIQNAIVKTDNGNADIVVDYILNNPNDHASSPNNKNKNKKNKKKKNKKNENDNINAVDGISGIVDDDEDDDNDSKIDENTFRRQMEKKKKAKERRKKMFALGPCPRLTKTQSESVIHKITSTNEALEAISLMFEHNFFIILINYILKQLLNSTDNCMICGEQLQYPGLKPTICLSPFCQFRLLEIGLGGGSDGGYGLGAEILGASDICDFLICCACAAAANPARSTIFFPTQVRGASSDTADESFLKSDGTTPDVEKLTKVIGLCPAIDSMKDWARQGEWSLKEELGKLHCLLYPYLIWVITSNRALIMKLQPDQLIKEIKTPNQFVMRSQTPERAEQFNNKKAQKGGVFYAWHGSGIFNWHSILRMGLKNYSNTKYMSAGAAYGAGIYTAEHSSTSLGYCTRGSGGMTWTGSKFGANVCCMALCEIVGPKKTWDKGNGIYVIADEASVATRYFFLFDSSQGMGGLSANSLTLPKWN